MLFAGQFCVRAPRLGLHDYWPRTVSSPRNSTAHRAPSVIVTGSVKSQDVKISAVIVHRTADSRRMAPTPRIDDVMACVVLTGMPSSDAIWITVAPATSAANP
jgi:hypothetical protein